MYKRQVREQLKKLCTQMISEWGLKCVLALFPSTDELDAAMRENPDSFDLLLLDIQMEGCLLYTSSCV